MVTFLPVGLAIAIFGTLYGAAAQPLLGTWLTLLSSVVIFSGTVQFSMVGLIAAGSGPLAVIWIPNSCQVTLGGQAEAPSGTCGDGLEM
jgi:predicted branched-subunit amino acid permease